MSSLKDERAEGQRSEIQNQGKSGGMRARGVKGRKSCRCMSGKGIPGTAFSPDAP